MTETVHCVVLDEELEALTYAPWPGELGQRIQQEVSAKAWQQWLNHQTMLINEKRLSPINPEHRKYLEQQMQQYLFGDGADEVEGFVPPSETSD